MSLTYIAPVQAGGSLSRALALVARQMLPWLQDSAWMNSYYTLTPNETRAVGVALVC